MFYSEYVLAKKGPLGKVWLAAHWNKKLTRAMIAKSDVIEACQSIMKPPAPLALRTSGHLLLGVVRIHDSKQKSLMNDCSEALIKIKVIISHLCSHCSWHFALVLWIFL
jgi:cohesin complex subunit SCC1